jgi:CheY-like chemotaxis protein
MLLASRQRDLSSTQTGSGWFAAVRTAGLDPKRVVRTAGLEPKTVARTLGLEPKTFGSGGRRSIQLSYVRGNAADRRRGYEATTGGPRGSSSIEVCGISVVDGAGETTLARVLVADDDPVIRRLLEVNLELEGHEVLQAGDGTEALAVIRAEDPDLVILDVMMPDMDGWQVRAAMLEDPALADVPVVFVSARAQEADKRRGDELRAAAYVTKPFDPIELMVLVADITRA